MKLECQHVEASQAAGEILQVCFEVKRDAEDGPYVLIQRAYLEEDAGESSPIYVETHPRYHPAKGLGQGREKEQRKMSTSVREISTLVLGLPVRSRALLADLLLDSLAEGTAEANEHAWLELARQRDREISAGSVKCRSHEQVMTAARKALRCSG